MYFLIQIITAILQMAFSSDNESFLFDLYIIILPTFILLTVFGLITLKITLKYDAWRYAIQQILQKQIKLLEIKKQALYLQGQQIEYENSCKNTKFIKSLIFILSNYTILQFCLIRKASNKIILLTQINSILLLNYLFPNKPFLSVIGLLFVFLYLIFAINVLQRKGKQQQSHNIMQIIHLILSLLCCSMSFSLCCLIYKNYLNIVLKQFIVNFCIGFAIQRCSRILIIPLVCMIVKENQKFWFYQQNQKIWYDIKKSYTQKQFANIVIRIYKLHKQIKNKCENNHSCNKKHEMTSAYLTEQSLLNQIVNEQSKKQITQATGCQPIQKINHISQSSDNKAIHQDMIIINTSQMIDKGFNDNSHSFNNSYLKRKESYNQQYKEISAQKNLERKQNMIKKQQRQKVQSIQSSKTKQSNQKMKLRKYLRSSLALENKENKIEVQRMDGVNKRQSNSGKRRKNFKEYKQDQIKNFDTIKKYQNTDNDIYSRNWDIYEQVEQAISRSLRINYTIQNHDRSEHLSQYHINGRQQSFKRQQFVKKAYQY